MAQSRSSGNWRRPVGWRNDSYRHYLAAKGVTTKRYLYSHGLELVAPVEGMRKTKYRGQTLPQFLNFYGFTDVKRPRLTSGYVLRRAGDERVPKKAELETLRTGDSVEIEFSKTKPRERVYVNIVGLDQRADYFVGEIAGQSTKYPRGMKILFKRKNVLSMSR